MGASLQPPSWYVFDTSSLIDLENLLKGQQFASLLDSLRGRIVIPVGVKVELGRVRSSPSVTWLEKNPSSIERHSFNIPEVGTLYLRLIQQYPGLGDGEAQAIALAHHRRGTLVTGDITAREIALHLGVRCLDAKEFLAQPLI